jgi:hypothetical protein
MGYSGSLTEGEVQKVNVKSANEWIEKNKSKIKAKPNETLLYSGRDFDLEKLEREVPDKDRKTFMGTKLYKRIEKTRKQLIDEKVPVDFQTLEDVLTTMRNCPVIIDRDRIEMHFAHAFDCYMELGKKPKLIPEVAVKQCWARLSEVFASNAVGDIKVLDGCADDYGLLKEDKDFIAKELEALLRNDQLSKEGQSVLIQKVQKYGALFDRRYTELIRKVEQSKKSLRGKR